MRHNLAREAAISEFYFFFRKENHWRSVRSPSINSGILKIAIANFDRQKSCVCYFSCCTLLCHTAFHLVIFGVQLQTPTIAKQFLKKKRFNVLDVFVIKYLSPKTMRKKSGKRTLRTQIPARIKNLQTLFHPRKDWDDVLLIS